MTSASKEHSAQVTTRIESLVDSVESLVGAILHARLLPGNANKHATNKAHRGVQDARAEMAAALREFMTPVVRVFDGGPQPFISGLREEDKPQCLCCNAMRPCKPSCEHWATAVRKVVANARGES